MAKENTEVISDADLLAMASAFEIIPFNFQANVVAGERREMRVEKRSSDSWAIISEGEVLNHDSKWEYEPLPSSRTKAFIKRCRWNTAREAVAFAQKYLRSSTPSI